jgi:hypothetical protein
MLTLSFSMLLCICLCVISCQFSVCVNVLPGSFAHPLFVNFLLYCQTFRYVLFPHAIRVSVNSDRIPFVLRVFGEYMKGDGPLHCRRPCEGDLTMYAMSVAIFYGITMLHLPLQLGSRHACGVAPRADSRCRSSSKDRPAGPPPARRARVV